MTPDEKLTDEFIIRSFGILRLSAVESQRAIKRLEQLAVDLATELGARNLSNLTKAKVYKVIGEAEDIFIAAYAEQPTCTDITRISDHVAKATARMLEGILIIHLANDDSAEMPAGAYLEKIASDVMNQGPATSGRRAAQSDAKVANFVRETRQGLINGEASQQIISRILGKFVAPVAIDVTRKEAAGLARTSFRSVANNVRLAVFKKNGDVLNGVRQVSTLDSHTSLICIAYSDCAWDLEGNGINTDLPFNGGPPRHFNCRSMLVGITKTFAEMGIDFPEPLPETTRASSSGQIPAKTTFNDYLERMGTEFQDEVLGKGRADLWRSGKITLNDLVNGQGVPLTLAQLVAKHA